MATFKISVSGEDVADEIRRRIHDGIKEGAEEINTGIERTAQARIRNENAVWTEELLRSFTDARVKIGNRTVAEVTNVSDHASPQEHGVSGTRVLRDTPHRYRSKRPPLSALLPWVIDNLYLSGFWPDDLGEKPDVDSSTAADE